MGMMNATKTTKIRLSPNQVSALECREGGGWDDPALIARCWAGGNVMNVATADVEALRDEINDASNGEDDAAEMGEPGARNAAKGLAAIAGKLWKITP